jgi:hypothetical protein
MLKFTNHPKIRIVSFIKFKFEKHLSIKILINFLKDFYSKEEGFLLNQDDIEGRFFEKSPDI